LVGTLAAIVYGVFRFGSAESFVASIDHTPRFFFDFVHYYYASAESLRQGRGPVAGYLYSPFLAIALMPLTSLWLELAMAAWAAVQALALALLILRTAALGPPGVLGGFLAALLTLLSTATLHSLKWGQVGLILGVLILEGVIALVRRRELTAAVLLGSAIAIKFYPAIVWPLAALRRRRAAAAILAVSAALLVLPPLLVLGERRTARFYRRLLTALSDTSATALDDPNSQAVTAWLRREFHAGGATEVALVGVALVLLTLVLLHLGEGCPPGRFGGPPSDRGILGGLVLAALVPFFVATCWPLYFCTLPALTLLTAKRWWGLRPSIPRNIALGILAMAGLAQVFPAVDLAGGWIRYVDQGWLLEADLAAASCALASLVPFWGKAGQISPPGGFTP
jgi:hypothetical protein